MIASEATTCIVLGTDSGALQRNASSWDNRPVICHVLHTLHVGGGEILARDFALANQSNFKPVFALLDDLGSLGRELRDEGYAVQTIGRRPGFDSRCVVRLRQFFRTQRVSLIHAHQYGPLFYSALARLPLARRPIVFTEHGRDFPDYRRWKRVLANRILLGSRDRFVAVGESVRQALIDYEGLPGQKIEVIYNGSELSAYDPHRPSRNDVRKELGLGPDAFVTIQVARLNRLKDHPTAIRVMERLSATIPRATLLMVGDGEERPAIERLVDELHLQDSVRLLGTRHDVPQLLQAADIFLLTSISEGIPLTLIEAMATGLPCVATRVGGVPEVVIHGQTGLLTESGNVTELVGYLRQLAVDEQMRDRLGHNGYRRAHQRFDARVMHASYEKLYCQSIGFLRGQTGVREFAP
jgi:glycosyltransferase involved in cell wall biosynthesis